MGSIFDENSEFIDYLKKKKEKESSAETTPEELYFKATPFKTDQNVDKQEPTELHIADENIKPEPKSAYTLNLKHIKLKESDHDPNPKQTTSIPPTEKPKQVKADPKISKLNTLHKKNTPTNNLAGFLWDKIKFLATTIAIFLVFFFALNWQAYSQILHNKYLQVTGKIDESPLNNFTLTAEDDPQTQEDLKISNSPFAVNHFSIPKINLEVIPPGTRIIVPRINSNVPIINVPDDKLASRDWGGLEADIQDALRDGVVHYPGTPWPDQSGNVVLTGHSSYYPWDPGRFKDVFALLHQVEVGDEIVIFYKQKKYIYRIDEIKVVLPSEVNVLGDTGDDRLTLITCTPIGTNLKRLIVIAKPVT